MAPSPRAAFFARSQYKDHVIYRELARREENPEFRDILEKLAAQERADYEFWKAAAPGVSCAVSPLTVSFFVLLRRVFGLTFTARFLEEREEKMVARYRAYLAGLADPAEREAVQKVIDHELFHERAFIAQIREEKVEFISSIVLGVNDGLIELTGALVGFSFAFLDHRTVATTGLITGIAAALSMAASAYLQARHEEGKNAPKAALYTGASYFTVVALMVMPFFLAATVHAALLIMGAIVLGIIAALSFYTSVLFERRFTKQFGEMFFFSIGVAAITFAIGSVIRTLEPRT